MTTRQMNRTVVGLLATCSVALVVGCASRATGPLVMGPDVYVSPEFLTLGVAPSPLVVPLASGPGNSGRRLKSTTSVDGTVGGTISLGRFSLEIPPGAFDEDGDITITIEDSLVLECELRITPGNLGRLNTPVLLHVACTGATNLIDPAGIAIVCFEPGNNWWREVEGNQPDAAAAEAMAPLKQFASYGVVQNKAGW